MRLVVVSVLFLLFSCNSGAQTGKEVSADQFEKDLQQGDVQLLDVRTAGEYRTGHIKKALQANWNDQKEFADRTTALDNAIKEEIPENKLEVFNEVIEKINNIIAEKKIY